MKRHASSQVSTGARCSHATAASRRLHRECLLRHAGRTSPTNMRITSVHRVLTSPCALLLAAHALHAQTRASAPDSLVARPRIEFFGQLVSDAIYDFNVVNPDFFDLLRPTQ